ncbi:hypothetical protein Tco_0252487 [Tanacetum coccineum]
MKSNTISCFEASLGKALQGCWLSCASQEYLIICYHIDMNEYYADYARPVGWNGLSRAWFIGKSMSLAFGWNNYDGLSLPQNRDNVQHNNKSEYVFGSSSQSAEIARKVIDYDMNLTYLQMSFLGISDESLSGVYATNEGDMERHS